MRPEVIRYRVWGSVAGAILGGIAFALVNVGVGRPMGDFSSVAMVAAIFFLGQVGRVSGEKIALRQIRE